MSKELAEVIVENGIVYRLGKDDLYYPDLRLPEGTHYNIGKYGLMWWEYLQTNCRREYLRLCRTARRTDESRGWDYGGTKGCQSDEMGGAYE